MAVQWALLFDILYLTHVKSGVYLNIINETIFR